MNGNERKYDLINNEGGEGYNPYRAAREQREFEAEKAWSKTRAGRKDRIYRDLERKDCSLARECGTYDQAEIDGLRAELAAIEAEETAEFIAAWPLNITMERRAAWNSRVRGGEFNNRGGKVDFSVVRAAEVAQGWYYDNLKKAVKYHNL
jgi:hypothetical protein